MYVMLPLLLAIEVALLSAYTPCLRNLAAT